MATSPASLRFAARLWPTTAALVVLATSSPSAAHGLDAGRYTVEREGALVRIVGTPRSADLRAFDDDGDGLLARTEVRAHRPALREAVDAGFAVTDQDGNAPACEITDVSTPGSGDPRVVEPKADHVRFTRVCRFATVPTALHVTGRFSPGDRAPSIVDAIEVSAPVNGARTLLRAVETIVLTSRAPTAVVLRDQATPPSRADHTVTAAPVAPSPWSALALVGLATLPSIALHRRRLRSLSPLPFPPHTPSPPSSPEASRS